MGGRRDIFGRHRASANLGTKKIEVRDTAFWPVEMSFKDSYLPGGYSPYTIRAVGNRLFVMYAVLGTDEHFGVCEFF